MSVSTEFISRDGSFECRVIETRNALITETMLGVEDHGILTAFLYLDFGGSSQGFGGYGLDAFDKKRDRRIGHASGSEFIRRVLDTLEVSKWEALKGKHCRARCDWSRVHAVGHIIKDQWFDPKRDLAFLLDTER